MEASKRNSFVHKMGKKKLGLPPKGSMVEIPKDEHSQKLDFVHKMTKTALDHIQHFDAGGTVLNGPGNSSNYINPVTTGGGIGGSISNALGLTDNFQAGAANIQAGTSTGQLNNAYTGVQQGLSQQEGLANTLNPQAATGVAEQNNLGQQFSAEAAGQGPNVAQNELSQATGQNVSNQAALAAGQRGASSNVGLMARQAAQAGAGAQQTAAGQAATLGAQQQIAAQQNEANLANNQITQAGSAAAANTGAQQGEQNILQGANTAYNNAGVGMQSNVNNTNAQTAATNSQGIGAVIGGVTGALGSVASFLAKGGEVKKPMMKAGKKIIEPKLYAGGGLAGNPLASNIPQPRAQSFSQQWLTQSQAPESSVIQQTNPFTNPSASDASSSKNGNQFGTAVGTKINDNNFMNAAPGSAEEDSALDKMFARGGLAKHKKLAAKGGQVNAVDNGEKAIKADNSYSNDKIPALLSEGEVVIPRSIMEHPMAPEKAAAFVRRVKAKKGLK